ncbi:hypothetical protein HYR54_09210 [Candidatus Acetothermia bacterium]|nr:hypothetical protein [Candidatus Acetothermia bacterium]
MSRTQEELREHLRFLAPGNGDESQGLLELLRAEYRRRLAHYENLDRALRTKYGLTFTQFERQHIVQKKDFSWDVESDAMAWEQAQDGIKTLKRRLKQLDALPQKT